MAELLEEGSEVERVFALERDLSNDLFEKITSSDTNFVPDASVKEEVRRLIEQIAEAREAARTRAEYKWCIDALEKWRYFLIANGEYVPSPRKVLPAFLSGMPQELPGAEEVRKRQIGNGRVIKGRAVKDAFDKTAKIQVVTRKKDSLTGKIINKIKNYLVHDEFNGVSEGDFVIAKECRPISKRKHFVVIDVDGTTSLARDPGVVG